MKEILYYFLARSLLSFIPQATQFPDETWQGPEVAHRDIFGYGWLTWEWSREDPIRSPVYHSMFSLIFYILKTLNLDYGVIVAYVPRIYQCLLSSFYDYYLIKLLKLEGIRSKFKIILVNYTIWFSLNCFSKTLINTFEAVIFTLAIYNWILYLNTGKERHNIICRILFIIVVVARHSAIIPWVFIWPFHLLTAKTNLKGKFKIFMINVATLIMMTIVSLLADYLYYKKLTSSFYNFLQFNLLSGNSAFFGVSHPAWFFTKGVPSMFLGWTIPLIIGMFCYTKQMQKLKTSARLFNYTIFPMIVLSFAGHKEDRFLLPLFPFFIYFICYGIENIESLNWNELYQKLNQTLSTKISCNFDYKINWEIIRIILIVIGILSNIQCFIYMNTHQDIGSLQMMSFIRNNDIKSIEFFTMCHQTPFYSFVHKNIPMYFPDCSPTKDLTSMEVFQLHQNPEIFIEQRIKEHNPSHIVIYNYLLNSETELLLQNYTKIESIYHHYSAWAYFDTPLYKYQNKSEYIKYNVEFVIYQQN